MAAVVARMQKNMEWMNRVVGTKPVPGEPQLRIEDINAFLARYASHQLGTRLRRRLLLLAAVAIVPLAAMAGIGVYALASGSARRPSATQFELARALATGVDAEPARLDLGPRIRWPLPRCSRKELRALLRRMPPRCSRTQPTWLAVSLPDPSAGVRTPASATAPSLRPAWETASFERVVTVNPAMMAICGNDEHLYFTVGRRSCATGTAYVLTAVVKPDAILDVVNRQRVPATG